MTSIASESLTEKIDKDEFYYGLKKRIYYAAKSGFSLNLATLLNKVDNADIRNVLVNQVRRR